MSATIGDVHLAHDLGRAAVLSGVGQETRTMSTPATSDRRIWAMVAAASSVGGWSWSGR
jgi:hypothetical protein